MDDTRLRQANDEVDAAWRRWKESPSTETEAAYDEAYQAWKALGRSRGVGRPPSGDQKPLTSSERSRAVRDRQQQSAAQWEKVAPLIQQLRRAHEAKDCKSIAAVVDSLVKETLMRLTDFTVVHAQPDSDLVVLHCWHGKEMVLVFIPILHLDDYFKSKHLTGKQANLIAESNLPALSRIASAKFERGEIRPYSRFGTTLPSVRIALEDILKSGEVLTDRILQTGFSWN